MHNTSTQKTSMTHNAEQAHRAARRAELKSLAARVFPLIPVLRNFAATDLYDGHVTPTAAFTDGHGQIIFSEDKAGRLTVTASVDNHYAGYGGYALVTPLITVSLFKTDAQIAADIDRRFALDFLTYVQKYKDNKQQMQSSASAAEHNARHAVNISKGTLNFNHTQDQSSRELVTEYKLHASGVDSGLISFRIGATSASIEMRSIPVELAERIAAVLGEYRIQTQ